MALGLAIALSAGSVPAAAQRVRGRAVVRHARRAPASAEARVCAGGDVTLGSNLDTTWVHRASRWAHRRIVPVPDPYRLLAPLAPLVSGADVVLVNLEGAIGRGPAWTKCRAGGADCFALRMPVATAAALREVDPAGAVVANLANNHSHDAGRAGLDTTIHLLTEAGVAVTGVDTLATPVALPEGDTIAFLGFTTSGLTDARHLDLVRRAVARAVARWPRLVVTMHIGAEGPDAQRTRDTMETYLDEQRGNPVAFAHAAADAGARLIVGHGPHVVRAAEWYHGALILYSLGNLVTYGPFSLQEPLDRGALLCASLDASGEVTSAQLVPTKQRFPGRLSADRSSRAVWLADSLSRLDFPRTAARFLWEAALQPRSAAATTAASRH